MTYQRLSLTRLPSVTAISTRGRLSLCVAVSVPAVSNSGTLGMGTPSCSVITHRNRMKYPYFRKKSSATGIARPLNRFSLLSITVKMRSNGKTIRLNCERPAEDASRPLDCSPRGSNGSLFGEDQRHVNQVLADEPDLHLVGPDDIAYQQIVRAVVAQIGSPFCQLPRILENKRMRFEQP